MYMLKFLTQQISKGSCIEKIHHYYKQNNRIRFTRPLHHLHHLLSTSPSSIIVLTIIHYQHHHHSSSTSPSSIINITIINYQHHHHSSSASPSSIINITIINYQHHHH